MKHNKHYNALKAAQNTDASLENSIAGLLHHLQSQTYLRSPETIADAVQLQYTCCQFLAISQQTLDRNLQSPTLTTQSTNQQVTLHGQHLPHGLLHMNRKNGKQVYTLAKRLKQMLLLLDRTCNFVPELPRQYPYERCLEENNAQIIQGNQKGGQNNE